MIRLYNPTKLTRSSFFQDLIAYLDQHEEVTLRQIKQDFAEERNLDRKLDTFIKASYIKRENRRYENAFSCLEDLENLVFDQETFVNSESPIFQELLQLRFETCLTNETNEAILLENTSFSRDELTLSNYFYKLAHAYPLSSEQEKLYAILGDVNPEYALKYMTNFLLKYVKKDQLMQKRRDIFVDSLKVLGYIEEKSEGKYELKLDFDKENLIFKSGNELSSKRTCPS